MWHKLQKFLQQHNNTELVGALNALSLNPAFTAFCLYLAGEAEKNKWVGYNNAQQSGKAVEAATAIGKELALTYASEQAIIDLKELLENKSPVHEDVRP